MDSANYFSDDIIKHLRKSQYEFMAMSIPERVIIDKDGVSFIHSEKVKELNNRFSEMICDRIKYLHKLKMDKI